MYVHAMYTFTWYDAKTRLTSGSPCRTLNTCSYMFETCHEGDALYMLSCCSTQSKRTQREMTWPAWLTLIQGCARQSSTVARDLQQNEQETSLWRHNFDAQSNALAMTRNMCASPPHTHRPVNLRVYIRQFIKVHISVSEHLCFTTSYHNVINHTVANLPIASVVFTASLYWYTLFVVTPQWANLICGTMFNMRTHTYLSTIKYGIIGCIKQS